MRDEILAKYPTADVPMHMITAVSQAMHYAKSGVIRFGFGVTITWEWRELLQGADYRMFVSVD
jgi:hypothetical protein